MRFSALRRAALPAFLAAILAATAAVAADDTPPGEVSVPEAWASDPARRFEASEVDPEELIWLARPVVIFADSPRDPAFVEQLEELADGTGELISRDVIVITDTDPAARSDLRQRLRPRGFMMVLIGKDGEVELRKPQPWTVRELSRSIDKMPLRRRELREGR